MSYEGLGSESEGCAMEQWETLQSVHARTTIPLNTLRKWVKEKRIPFYRINRRIKCKVAEIDRWMEKGRIEPVKRLPGYWQKDKMAA